MFNTKPSLKQEFTLGGQTFGFIPNLEDIPRLSAGDEIVARPIAAGDVVEAQPGDDQSIRRLMTVRAHARMALLNYPKRK